MNITDLPVDDHEYAETRVKAVRLNDDWYTVDCDDFGFGLQMKWGVEPHVGDRIRTYGSLGRPIRGVVVNDRVAYYRTPAEQDVENERIAAEQQDKRRQEYEVKRAVYEAQIAALPQEFQDRIARFRRNNPDFPWEFMPYELFCCGEAVKIAKRFSTREDISAFHKLKWEQQKMAAPELAYDEHSGNTFGAACSLAALYVEHPELVDKYHGALCPLVGCKAYGCYSTEIKT